MQHDADLDALRQVGPQALDEVRQHLHFVRVLQAEDGLQTPGIGVAEIVQHDLVKAQLGVLLTQGGDIHQRLGMAGIQPRHAGGIVPVAAVFHMQRRVRVGPDKVTVAKHGHAGHGVFFPCQQRLQVVHGIVLLHRHLLGHLHLCGIGNGAVDALDLNDHGVLRYALQYRRGVLPQDIAGQHPGTQYLQMRRIAVVHIVNVHIAVRYGRVLCVRLGIFFAKGPLHMGFSCVVIDDIVLQHQEGRRRQNHHGQRCGQRDLLAALTPPAAVVMISLSHTQGWILSSRPTRRA